VTGGCRMVATDDFLTRIGVDSKFDLPNLQWCFMETIDIQVSDERGITESTFVARCAGRPTDYRPEYADQLLEYFRKPAWDQLVDGRVVEGFFPTLAGFSCQIDKTRATLWLWATARNDDGTRKHPEFAHAFEQVKDYQEDYFVKGYMAGKYRNPGIGALIAKNLLDWKDKQEIAQTLESAVAATVASKVKLDLAEMVALAKSDAAEWNAVVRGQASDGHR
jgi:hypothetical protein